MLSAGSILLGVLLGALIVGLPVMYHYRRRLRSARLQAEEQQVRMQKLEQVRSTFVANVTHELKTPLTSIKGYVELLRDGRRDETTRQGFYEIIDIESERLQVLIEDILQLSEIENSGEDPRQHACDLHALGNALYGRFLPWAEQRGVQLRVRIPQGLLVHGSDERLMQLVGNLVDNAIKYNRPGGGVLLRAWHEQGHTVIRVSDTGIGIPPAHLEHVFERFYRVDKGRSRELGGTGLGLSIVKHVAQLLGGSIEVASKPEKGAMFTVRIPDEGSMA